MGFAFLALGFLVGNVTGLSASPIAMALIPAIFTLAGGSVLAFLSNVAEPERKIAAKAILAFSLGCLSGVYFGIVVTTHQLLGSPVAASPAPPTDQAAAPTPGLVVDDRQPQDQAKQNAPRSEPRTVVALPVAQATARRPAARSTPGQTAATYLRSGSQQAVDSIDQQVRNHTMSVEEGYRRLVALARGEQE